MHLSSGKEKLDSHKNLYTNVHSSYTCNRQDLKATQMSLDRWKVGHWCVLTMEYTQQQRGTPTDTGSHPDGAQTMVFTENSPSQRSLLPGSHYATSSK